MNPLAWLSSALSALASFLGIIQKRQELENTPAMQANAQAKTDEKLETDIAATETAAAKGDAKALEQLRKDVAE